MQEGGEAKRRKKQEGKWSGHRKSMRDPKASGDSRSGTGWAKETGREKICESRRWKEAGGGRANTEGEKEKGERGR